MPRNRVDRNSLTAERLRTVLRYEAETGEWTWLVTNSNRKKVGSPAGVRRPEGYKVIGVDGHVYRANRLAWLYMTGEWPKGEVDHKDTDTTNDKWDNLRDATDAQNNYNHSLRSDNTSGLKRVSFDKSRNKFKAYINTNGKQKFLGRFNTAEEAHTVACTAAAELHGEFARVA